MASITDWHEAFSYLRHELVNEFMHAGLQEAETQQIQEVIIKAFSNLEKEIGNEPFDE